MAARHGSDLAHATSDSTRVIGEVFGGAMGLLLALSPLLYSWREATTGERLPGAIAPVVLRLMWELCAEVGDGVKG